MALSKEQQRERHRKAGNVSYCPQPFKKKARSQPVSYKLRADKYNLGPLDKILLDKSDRPPRAGSKRKKIGGKLTLNSFIDFGLYRGQLISNIFVKDKPYLQYISGQMPNAFSKELLEALK